MSSDFIVVFVAVGQEKEAELIARTLIDESLAACVNLIRQNSVYRWKGEIVEDEEILLVIKTHQTQFTALRERVTALLCYEV
ncbi:MAG: divalent-cation tolerance protein CutA, partial [Candidatus Hermodarchaeota archaeon]|nr:divalent-cation tolerance protein CutA [Candidatus Hermodarchaeota archaeon]